MKRRSFLNLAASAAMLPALLGLAMAQTYPSRPVTMVVPFAAGTSADVLGRIFATGLSETLGQQVVVENVGGAGGMNGANRVAKAPADGYQFLLGSAATHAFNQTLYKHPLYDAVTDFSPVTLVSDIPLVLVTRKDLPANNLPEFIAYAKANQAKMQYGSAGVSSANHVVCLLLNSAIGVDVTQVPYRDNPNPDLIAGRIDYFCMLAANAVAMVGARQVKGIAVLAKTRISALPELPTAQEQGLPDFDGSNWNAVFLPKGAPAPIVQKLHDAAAGAMELPALRQRMSEVGSDFVAPERRSPEYLRGFVEAEIKKWAVPIRAANLATD